MPARPRTDALVVADSHPGGPAVSQSVVAAGARGGAVALAGSAATMVIQAAAVVTLSRLLAPQDFGLVAMVSVFVALGNLIRDFGMPTAALQARDLTSQQAANFFWMNSALGAGAAVALTAAAPVLVLIYAEPRLLALVPSLALVILLNGVGAQIQVHLARRMRYRVIVVTDVVAQAVGLLAAIVVALDGWGYWALVVQTISSAAIQLATRWLACHWLPTWPRRGHGSAHMFRAGVHYGVAQLLAFLQTNADTIVLGIRLGATPLGYYNRAFQLLAGPTGRVLDPLTQVVIPSLNRMGTRNGDYGAPLLRIQFIVGLGVVWIFAMAAGSAQTLIPLLLGPGWEPSVEVFQVLAIGGCIGAFSHVSYWAFIAYGKSRELLRYNIVSKPLAVICIIAGSFFGVPGVAWGYVVGMAVSWPLNMWWLHRTADLSWRPFALNGLLLLCGGGAGFGLTLFCARWTSGWSVVAGLPAGVLVGSAAMLGFLLIFRRGREFLVRSLGLVRFLVDR